MKSVKVRPKLTFRYLLRLTLEGLTFLFSYLLKYIPWIALVVVFFYMSQYEIFRRSYCFELENQPVRSLVEEEVDYMDSKCEYDGHWYIANVEAVQKYAKTSFRFSVILTIALLSLIPYVIVYYWKKEAYPPKTIISTIVVFVWWLAFLWILSAILIYDPIYDWLKDILTQPEMMVE